MPNYVYAQLYIYGDKAELQKFKEYAQGENEFYDDSSGYDNSLNWKLEKIKVILDMNKFIPYPDEFKEIDRKQKEYLDKINKIKEKIKSSPNQEGFTDEDKKIANELALVELESGNGGNDFRNILKDGYNSGGYNWCVQNWGTKWNFCECILDESDEDELHYTFQTAWSVPMPVLFEMSRRFPELEFNYLGDEESEEFEVDYHFKAGKITESEEKSWADIQIEKIKEGNLDNFEDEKELHKELEKHKGHEIEYSDEDDFKCKTCNNKIIWKR